MYIQDSDVTPLSPPLFLRHSYHFQHRFIIVVSEPLLVVECGTSPFDYRRKVDETPQSFGICVVPPISVYHGVFPEIPWPFHILRCRHLAVMASTTTRIATKAKDDGGVVGLRSCLARHYGLPVSW